MTGFSLRLLQEADLEKMDAALAVSPESPETLELQVDRALLLDRLGRKQEAKSAYLEALQRAPSHFRALNNFGNMLYAGGFKKAARLLYAEAVRLHPQNPIGHVNLANLLAEGQETDLAMRHFETALRLDPENAGAHRGMAYLLTESRDEERAQFHREKAFHNQPLTLLPYYGEGEPVRVILLVSAYGGIIPLQHHLDERVFLVTVLFVEFFDASAALPPHHLVFNAIGDADLCGPALEAALRISAKTTAPVLNHPRYVLPTGRVKNAVRLGQIEDVITPRTALLPRAALKCGNVEKYGFRFPLLIRSPGFHTGRFFARVENAEDIALRLPEMPGDELLAIAYLDARSPDGKIRKYRVMMVDGVLYPLHVAIASDWKVHYFTADMAHNSENRAEDAAFLENMEQVLGKRAMTALNAICKILKLDYGGMDFSLNAEGKVLLFEANATMVVYPPDKDLRWEYRNLAVERIMAAIQNILTRHA